jgi:hypothetical protein
MAALVRSSGEIADEKYAVTTSIDGADDAKFLWLRARKRPDAPKKWSGCDFEATLVKNVNEALADKCAKSYGPQRTGSSVINKRRTPTLLASIGEHTRVLIECVGESNSVKLVNVLVRAEL